MDKRKLRFTSALHKNLIPTNSHISNDSTENDQYSTGRSQKRKSLSFCTEEESYNYSQDTTEKIPVKKRRNDICTTSPSINKADITSQVSIVLSNPTKAMSNSTGPIKEITNNMDGITVPSQIIENKYIERRRRSPVQQVNQFYNLLEQAGIVLLPDKPHKLNADLQIVISEMKKLLKSGKYAKEDIIHSLEEYMQNDLHFQNALNDMDTCCKYGSLNDIGSMSLIRLLLQVTDIQPMLYKCLLCKLNDSVLLVDSPEKLPWVRKLLHQFRFLKTVEDIDLLTSYIQQLLESCPTWFQCELILFLPDIIIDSQHHAIAEILSKLMEDNSDLIGPILDCITNLTLGKEYMADYTKNILKLLKENVNAHIMPAIVKFLLSDITNLEAIEKMLLILRKFDIKSLLDDKTDDCTIPLHVANMLRRNFLLSKDIVQLTITIIKDTTNQPKPFDIVLLLLIFSIRTLPKKRNIESIFRNYIQSGFYRSSLLHLLYDDYKLVVQEFQEEVVHLASNLLKAEERVYSDFGAEWIRLQFMCQADVPHKQREIIEKIVLLIGNSNQTAKNALKVLCKMASNKKENDCLQMHCNHLRVLLEKMDNLDLEEVGTLSDLLHSLSMACNSTSEALRDDLFILLQKQLFSTKYLTKCRGALGAVMGIKHLAVNLETNCAAHDLFEKVLTAIKNCPRSQGLFYDQLTQVVQTNNLSAEFLRNIHTYIEEEFINTYMIDKSSYGGDLIPKFGLNDGRDEPQNCVLHFVNPKYGATIAVLFKVLKTCCQKLSENGDLDAIDALLGCAILMPENIDVADSSTLDLIMCCINWFREVISAFVTQTDLLLQKQVLKRLDNLMQLHGELNRMLSLCDTKYQPPPCYFHYFPVPSFIRDDRRLANKRKKRGKDKSLTLRQLESWEIGSTISSKNPAYFRKLDAKVVHLLDLKTDLHSSQNLIGNISIPQTRFLVIELLGIIENEPNETFIKDLIHLLPKVCAKLSEVVARVREEDNLECIEAIRLLLCLLTSIFDWKGFRSITYNTLLRDGLRTVASQLNEANAMLRSCKELVTESYKYFESLSDVATQISLAVGIINVCRSVMRHSETYTEQHKDKHAKMSFGFLCLDWPNDTYGSSYKEAISGLLNNWIDNEPLPLNTMTTLLEWLPDETVNLEKLQDKLNRLPSISKSIFHLLYKKIFDGIIKGIPVSLTLTTTDQKKILVWQHVASNVQRLLHICKSLKTKANILLYLRCMPAVLKLFLKFGMPILEHNLKYQKNEVISILKMMQGCTRYLHAICCDSMERKDVMLTKYVPAAKSVLEKLVYSVKGMLVLNNSTTAFWMGNLVNKNLDGLEIHSQASSEDSSVLEKLTDDLTYVSSEILSSDESPEDEDEANDTNGNNMDL